MRACCETVWCGRATASRWSRKDRSELSRDGLGLIRGGVLRAGPEEAAQAVLAIPRHDMDVEVGHALADAVVDRDERTGGAERGLHRAREPLRLSEQRSDELRRQVDQRLVVHLGHEQGV